jgi:hypothetical protein
MFIILEHWRSSLELLKFSQLFEIIKQSCRFFMQGVILLVRHFYWLLAIDLFLFVASTRTLLKTIETQKQATTLAFSPGAFYLLVLMQGAAFALSGIFFLFLKKQPTTLASIPYLKAAFPRYLQFYLFVSIILFFGIIFITGAGITKFPMVPQPVLITFKMIEVATLFYWMNSQGFFKNLFGSFESGINIIVYNLPIFLLLGGLLFGINMLIQFCAFGTFQPDSTMQITATRSNMVSIIGNENFSFHNFLIAKYLKLFLEYFWIAIMLSVYENKKDIRYTKTLFE